MGEGMKTIAGLEELRQWTIDTNNRLRVNQNNTYTCIQVRRIQAMVDNIASQVTDDYPFYSQELPSIARNLFRSFPNGSLSLNVAAFGELFIIIMQLHNEPINVSFWSMIHPRIVRAARALYLDTHYASAANRALVEVETRLRELFKMMKPDAVEPNGVGDLIGALLTENGAYQFCDTSTPSGRNYRTGIQRLFEGAFSAYRNPSSHANFEMSKEDSFAQIVLASQLMDVVEPR
jgi:hypothetical protein